MTSGAKPLRGALESRELAIPAAHTEVELLFRRLRRLYWWSLGLPWQRTWP